MKKFTGVLFLILLCFSLYAQEKSNWKTWYENFLKTLKYKVEKKISPKSRITAVAAVRGTKQQDKSKDIYWKSSSSQKAQEKISADRQVLISAVESIVNGDIEKGRAQLNDFIEKNPDSYFISEAKEALDRLPDQNLNKQDGSEVKNIKQSEDKTQESSN